MITLEASISVVGKLFGLELLEVR